MEVKQIVSSQFIAAKKSTTIAEVMEQFLENHHDIACVIEEERLIGVVTKYSLYRLLLNNYNIHDPIEDAIIYNAVTLNENDNIYRSRDKLIKMKVAHAIVLNKEQKVVGILSSSNIFDGLIQETKYISNQLSKLMNNLQSIIISVDLDLKITTLNNSAYKLIKQQDLTLTYDHISYLFPDLTNNIIEVIQTNALIDYKTIEMFNTKYISSFIPIRAWNQITGVMIVLDNVSKYEKIAKELESTKRIEQTLDSALEVAYDGVVITDPVGEIVRVNEGFLDLLQITNSEKVIGKQLKAIVPEIPIEKSIDTAKHIEGEYIKINDVKTVVTLTPIFRDKENIGFIVKILFRQLEQWKELFNHMNQLENEISYYRSKLEKITSSESSFNHIISTSKKINNLKHDAQIAAKGFSNVLITGESGTGKDLFAQGIHCASGRSGEFIKINCAAIPADLLESELFGYEDGAFTGAKQGGKPGKLELAHNGTLFLDEIGDMPIALQVKLLRVLQDQRFERIGGIETKHVDIRIITATNRDLLSLIKEGKFREDLYYRINVIHLHLPPLRERKEDISYLATHFIDRFNERMEKHVQGINDEALTILNDYDWPGNVRELENILERAFHFCQSDFISKQDILLDPTNNPSMNKQPNNLAKEQTNNKLSLIDSENILEKKEKELIIQALHETNGNRTQAAKLLNISRSTLYYKLRRLDIQEVNKFR